MQEPLALNIPFSPEQHQEQACTYLEEGNASMRLARSTTYEEELPHPMLLTLDGKSSGAAGAGGVFEPAQLDDSAMRHPQLQHQLKDTGDLHNGIQSPSVSASPAFGRISVCRNSIEVPHNLRMSIC